MQMIARLLLLLWILCSLLVAFSNCRTLCSRIFFQNINEETMPYKIIEGVYTKENYSHNNFPVYRRENGNLLFYYSNISTEDEKRLIFGLNPSDYFGVAAHVYNAVDPVSWLTSGSLDRSDVFGGLISFWQFWNISNKSVGYVTVSSSSPMIKAVCVDEDFRECNSDRLYLNVMLTDGKGNVVNDHIRDYFLRKPGVFRNLRPLYEHSRQKWYLQYNPDGFWVVTERYAPSRLLDNVFIKTKDFALRPEYISKTWSVHDNKGWRDMPNLRLLCRGVNSMLNTCPSKPCDSKATCIYTFGKETLCLCPSGYTGVTCYTNKPCRSSIIAGTELKFAYFGNRPGDLGLFFCRGRYPSVRFAFCVDSKYSAKWTRQGRACRGGNTGSDSFPWTPWYRKNTERSSYQRTDTTNQLPTAQTSRVDFDANPVIFPVVLSSFVLLKLLVPFIIYCCAVCKKKSKEDREEREDTRRLQEDDGELGTRLEQVVRAGSQMELDSGIQDYQPTVQGHQRENENGKLSRKRGLYRNASLWRIFSMLLFFYFHLWVLYLVGCEISQCTRYGRSFVYLKIFGIAMLWFSSVYIFIESIFSRELDYLRNIMQDETAWNYIQKMHQLEPRIDMVVECYHPTRDDSKVVTFVDHKEFSFGSWVDASEREIPTVSTVWLTRVRIDPYVLFGDQETADSYERQRAVMISRNRFRDLFTDFSASRKIPGLKKRISAYVDSRVKPWWIRPLFFWLATLLQMTWPYRWLFRAKTGKSHYALKKLIYKSTTPQREVDLMNPVTTLADGATSATDSSVLENSQISYPMAEIVNTGRGSPAYENGCPPRPPGDPSVCPPLPVAPQQSASPATYDTGTSYPPPLNNPYPTGGAAYPTQPPGPVHPPYSVVPQPDEPPPSYDAAVGFTPDIPQASNENIHPGT